MREAKCSRHHWLKSVVLAGALALGALWPAAARELVPLGSEVYVLQ